MTKRQAIRRTVGRVMGAVSVLAFCAVVCLICSQLFRGDETFDFLFFTLSAPLAIAAIGALVFTAFFVTCPDCKKPIGMHFLVSGITTTQTFVNRDWGCNHCPHCGADLNQEIETK